MISSSPSSVLILGSMRDQSPAACQVCIARYWAIKEQVPIILNVVAAETAFWRT